MVNKHKSITLTLEDGSTIEGKSFGAHQSVAGEVVFNTAMVGYPENLTDPSYKGQILVVTYPMVGNYGVPSEEKIEELEKFMESEKIQIAGLVINYYSDENSHWNSYQKLGEWLEKHNVPAIYGVDTRSLTKKLREQGAMLGKIETQETKVEFENPNERNLVAEVSVTEVKTYGDKDADTHILLVDCGVKNNIIRCFTKRGLKVTRVPWNYDFSSIQYDGLFISNGPGDPTKCDVTIENLKTALAKEKPEPIFGICLGNQLVGLAAGAESFKLKYGHRSHNQPVRKTGTNECYITPQNHGYALDDKKLPSDWELYFENLNDGTCEGIKHKEKPFFTVQFHPEAMGGPTDTEFLFDDFIEVVKKHKNA